MIIDVAPGKYVVAVSGGIDSMVLLDILSRQADLKLTVAHFDHGIRLESREDRLFVEGKAREYGLPFIYAEGQLGARTSEAAARKARYDFLRKAQLSCGARAIMTAHHQDDVLETAVINLLRGTGRKGLTSLASGPDIMRPLLAVSKDAIRRYAVDKKLEWREDATNTDTMYLRNYVRHNLVPQWTGEQRKRFYDVVEHMRTVNRELDMVLERLLDAITVDGRLDRPAFILLPHHASLEVMAAWLRKQEMRDFDRKTLERLTQAAKISTVGTRTDVIRGTWMETGPDFLALKGPER